MSETEKKEMISCEKKGSKYFVKINYSSLDIINTCMRKARYLLHDGLRAKTESPALSFGTAIHKALEYWYQIPIEERKMPTHAHDIAQAIAYGQDAPDDPVFNTVKEFVEAGGPLREVPQGDKRSLANGAKILVEYCKRYKDDGLTVVYDSLGEPLIERMVTFRIYDNFDLAIDYFGTIDVILENRQTGVVAVTDHKTTSQLGKEFYNRVKPNHQYTGYVMGAEQALGIESRIFMVNGIQTAKTKQEFARQFTNRNEEDFEELTNSVEFAVRNYIRALESGKWTQNAPQPCTMYGGCQFIKACEVPENIRANVIRSLWNLQ